MLLAVLFVIKLGSNQTIKPVGECINCGICNGLLFSAENKWAIEALKDKQEP